MYRDFQDKVEFRVVYIQEAHASDAWQLASNLRDNVIYANPKTDDERGQLAGTCVRKLGIEIPAIVDGVDNAVEVAYTAWPDRLYVIDKSGRIAFKSDPGPFGFKPEQVRRILEDRAIY